MPERTWVETLPYPTGALKQLYRSPILLYRLGLGALVGRLFMVMTTTGRKTGLPRRTAIEFHEFNGRRYVLSGWGAHTDWYRNLQADPRLTIQTWRGAESVVARPLETDEEMAEAYRWAMASPALRAVARSVGFDLTLEQFLAQKDRFKLITFDPTDSRTPEPVRADLWWVWPVIAAAAALLALRRAGRSRRPRGPDPADAKLRPREGTQP